MAMAFGIDLGGTKIEIIALDEDGNEKLRRRTSTPQQYDATLEAIKDLVDAAEADLGLQGTLGISHPGAISPATGLMKNANSTWLNGRSFDKDLQAHLERPIAFTNDANCLALSEATDGAGAGAGVVFGVIIGTGVGGGIAANGKVLSGPNAVAGEWGHVPLPWPRDDERPGPDCYCGLKGCVETWLSGTGFAADYARTTGDALRGPDIMVKAAAGDSAAIAAIERYEDRLARGLAIIINILDPDVIVLGGGMSNVQRLYTNVPSLWGRHAFTDEVRTGLKAARFGDSSGVRGAAWLGRDLAA